MIVKATCERCGELYRSSEINGVSHSENAERKAARIGEDHILEAHRVDRKAPTHEVVVERDWIVAALFDSDAESRLDRRTTVAVLRMRCARCARETPGLVNGRCEGCVFEGFTDETATT